MAGGKQNSLKRARADSKIQLGNQDHRMPNLLKVIVTEIVLFLVSLTIFPAIILALLVYKLGDTESGLMTLYGAAGHFAYFWLHLISPYLVIQAIRARAWSQRSLLGRRFAYLYFFVLSAGVFWWAFYNVWDLFYFMYTLGDIPAELRQLVEIEWKNILISITALVVGAYSFRVFLNPERKKNARSTE